MPALADGSQIQSKKASAESKTLFYEPGAEQFLYFYNGIYYRYINNFVVSRSNSGLNLATSEDGVHWKDHGLVIGYPTTVAAVDTSDIWSVHDEHGTKFITSFCEWSGPSNQVKDYLSWRAKFTFLESRDLMHWTRLSPKYDTHPDTRWYQPNERWSFMYTAPRPGGGLYGYWSAVAKDKQSGFGMGESLDGVNWRTLKPAPMEGVPYPLMPTIPWMKIPELSALHAWRGKYYAIVTAWDEEHPGTIDNPGMNTLIADSPFGPFRPAPKNLRLLASMTSYWVRFVDTPDGVLASCRSWELSADGLKRLRQYLAPFKRAEWDEEGTLRLKWWEGNEKAKLKRVHIESQLVETAFDPNEVLILEGIMTLLPTPTGLYLQGTADKGTGFLVHRNGMVEYGDINRDGSNFEKKGYVDRELSFEGRACFRIIRTGRITEFYLNNYLMQCYCLPEQGTGRIGLIGAARDFQELNAWYCA